MMVADGPARRVAGATNAPYVVIDAVGEEGGVLVDYGQYVRLLELVAAHVGRRALPPYWRRALDGCLVIEAASAFSRSPGSGAMSPGRRPGRARRSAPGES